MNLIEFNKQYKILEEKQSDILRETWWLPDILSLGASGVGPAINEKLKTNTEYKEIIKEMKALRIQFYGTDPWEC